MGYFFDLITIGIGWALGEFVLYFILFGLFAVGWALCMSLVSLWDLFKRVMGHKF